MSLRDYFARPNSKDKALSEFTHNNFGFYPRNITLYQLAFTHKSASEGNVGGYRLSNERLEYLGDAVLSAVVADYLFRLFPTKPEGFLTEMRSRIVSRASLNKLSQKLGFEQMVHYTHDVHANFKSLLGNAFEAFVGALYLDRGYEFTKKILINRIIKVHIDLEQLEQTDVNFKSKLLEWSQKEKHHVLFKILNEKNNSKGKLYHVVVIIDDKEYAQGSDYSIKGSEQLAAEKTWNMLVEQHIINPSNHGSQEKQT
ncbi:MAG: ribonuclease III [Bacteroidales bacterium]|jgi:ribonuclease-3|nr:ribonuclease III [Bacteroidales bacterium]